jgi:hypothetical protein
MACAEAWQAKRFVLGTGTAAALGVAAAAGGAVLAAGGDCAEAVVVNATNMIIAPSEILMLISGKWYRGC